MFKEFIRKIADSLNPNVYTAISTNTYKDSFKYLFSLILLFSLLNSFFLLPSLTDFYSNFNENFEKIESINSSISIKTNEPIILTSKPLILIDSETNTTNNEYILITKDTIYKKGLFNYKNITTKNINFADYVKNSKTKITILMILSLPTIFLLYLLFNIIKYSLMIFFVSLIAISIVKLIDRALFIRQIINASIFSTTLFLLLKFLLRFTTGFKSLIPFILYLVWLIIVLILMTESKVDYNMDKPKPRKNSNKTIYVKRKNDPSAHVSGEDMEKINSMLNKQKR
jgi:hypothetical protein